jgi:3-methyladenine DNA glycosylase AlkD
MGATVDDVMKTLEKAGTEQNRKVYARHGVGPEQFGVSFKELRVLGKKLKGDNKLAADLWKTKNHDARILATMVADPATVTEATLDRWVKQIRDYPLADEFAGNLAYKSPFARQKMEEWTDSDKEFIAQCGWVLLAKLAMDDKELEDAYFNGYLGEIESDIHAAPNRAKYSMNSALIAIGMRDPALQKVAMEAAKRIGTVEVDHGETGCKTPDAYTYMQKKKPQRSRKKPGKASSAKGASRGSSAKKSAKGTARRAARG